MIGHALYPTLGAARAAAGAPLRGDRGDLLRERLGFAASSSATTSRWARWRPSSRGSCGRRAWRRAAISSSTAHSLAPGRARDAMAAGAARSAALDARLAAAAEATARTVARLAAAPAGPCRLGSEARSGLARIVAEVGPAPDARA